MAEEITIGIDLGTSNSCVATIVDSKPQVLPNTYGENTTASVVAFGEKGKVTVGNQAKAQVILDPANTISSSKRLIGRYYFSEEAKKARAVCSYEIVSGEQNSVRIQVRGKKLSLSEISGFILKEMKSVAEKSLGVPVTKAVLTVPAYFNDNQRQATKDAGQIAGLDVLRILNEPTAAALAYGYGRKLQQKVAVYDLGGGTFDVSVLEIGDDVFEVLSTCGDTYLGGDDFDDRLIDMLAEHIQTEHGFEARSEPVALEKLRAAAERAKIELSTSDPVTISIPDLAQKDGKTIGIEKVISAAEFEKLTRDLIHRTFKVCDEAMQEAGLTVRDLDGIIMVGGPTRLPTVRYAVSEYFQRQPEVDINPDEVVALGAAIHAHSLTSTESSTCLLDVTPLSLRVGIAGAMTDIIIERNSPVPIDHSRIFTTAQDDQKSVAVRIYQGESRGIDGNTLLGEFEFAGYEPGTRGEVQIEVTFAISTEGIVRVSARCPRTGAERSTTVSMSSSLSAAELKQIVAQAPPPRAPAEGASDLTETLPLVETLEMVEDEDVPALEGPDDLRDSIVYEDRTQGLFGSIDTDLSPQEEVDAGTSSEDNPSVEDRFGAPEAPGSDPDDGS